MCSHSNKELLEAMFSMQYILYQRKVRHYFFLKILSKLFLCPEYYKTIKENSLKWLKCKFGSRFPDCSVLSGSNVSLEADFLIAQLENSALPTEKHPCDVQKQHGGCGCAQAQCHKDV
jgi:hypothetical protein